MSSIHLIGKQYLAENESDKLLLLIVYVNHLAVGEIRKQCCRWVRLAEIVEVSLLLPMVQFMLQEANRCKGPKRLWYSMKPRFQIVANLYSGFEQS